MRFQTLVIRAVARLHRLLAWFRPHWDHFDRMLVLKGPAWIDERGEARHLGLLQGLALRKLASYPLIGTESESVLLQICPKDFCCGNRGRVGPGVGWDKAALDGRAAPTRDGQPRWAGALAHASLSHPTLSGLCGAGPRSRMGETSGRFNLTPRRKPCSHRNRSIVVLAMGMLVAGAVARTAAARMPHCCGAESAAARPLAR